MNGQKRKMSEADKELLKIGWIKNDDEYIRNYPNTSYYEILRFDTEKMFTAFTGNGSPLSLTFNELEIIYKKAKELWK